MAEIALTAVINKAIDLAANAAVQEGSRLYWLREDIMWIKREMEQINAYLKDEDAKQVGSEGMRNLNKNIRELACDIEDILEAFLPQMASHESGHGVLGCFRRAACIFCLCCTSHYFAMEIEKIKRRVTDIDRPKETYDISDEGSAKDTWDPRRPFVHVEEPYFTGHGKELEDLKAKLLDEEIKFDVIAIVGMPGLGKTTLAKKVFKSTQNQFQCSALVYVSQEPNVRDVLQDIARQVGMEKEKWEVINVEANLSEHLQEKRYLIMFDDIWNTQTWEALKIGIPVNSENGSRVILTSRNTDVGRYVSKGCSPLELQPLSPEDSWKLFSKMVLAPGTPSITSELEGIGREIVERCGGVPLAIVVTVGLLWERERTMHRWSEVLNGMGTLDAGILNTLALSYRDLPIELKPCFLYFGMFPEDYEISVFQLINLWIAERFIKVVGDQTLEEVAEAYRNKLFARNLIQVVKRKNDGRTRSCRIHDLLHSLCISVAEDINFFNTKPATTMRRLAWHSGGTNNSRQNSIDHRTPKLRALFFFDNNVYSPQFYFSSKVKFLRVLRMEVAYFDYNLAYNIGTLIHLVYLGIRSRDGRRNVNQIIPDTISNLKSLMTLDLQGLDVDLVLPTSILKMKQLRHILINSFHHFYEPNLVIRLRKTTGKDFFPVEVSSPNLQTISCLDERYFETNWLLKLPNLRKLGIIVSDGYGVLDALSEATILHKLEKLTLTSLALRPLKFDLSGYQNLLRLRLSKRKWKLTDLNTFPPNLTDLSLASLDFNEDFIETLKMLPKLKYLKISHCNVSVIRACSEDNQYNFPQLEVLKLQNLLSLEGLIVEEGGMPRLKTLIIKDCRKISHSL